MNAPRTESRVPQENSFSGTGHHRPWNTVVSGTARPNQGNKIMFPDDPVGFGRKGLAMRSEEMCALLGIRFIDADLMKAMERLDGDGAPRVGDKGIGI